MRFKKISSSDRVSMYAIAESESYERVQLINWLEENFPNEYELDMLHLTINTKAELLFALKWVCV